MDTPAPIKFDNSFTELAEQYFKVNEELGMTLGGFAYSIGTTEETVMAWASKKKKDAEGNLTQELARPKFNAAINAIKNFKGKEEKKPESKKKVNKKDETLNEKQEMFCQLYATNKDFFGNGVVTYAEVYDLDLGNPKDYNTAKSNAWRLLTNDYILKRVDELLELGTLNDTFVDRQLAKLITQDADFGSKVSAIREYNKLKARITEKVDHTTKGDKIAPIMGGNSVSENNSD
jgi:hypothetical protein